MGLDTKEKLKGYIEREQLHCVLSNTKWNRLFEQLELLQDKLDFQRKDLDRNAPDESQWNGDIYEIFGLTDKIEWLNIRIEESQLELLAKALEKANTPYSHHPGGVRVWGYLRKGVSPTWVHT